MLSLVTAVLIAESSPASSTFAPGSNETLRQAVVTSVAPSHCGSGVVICYARITVGVEDHEQLDLFLRAEPDDQLPGLGKACDFEVHARLGGGFGDRLPNLGAWLEVDRAFCGDQVLRPNPP